MGSVGEMDSGGEGGREGGREGKAHFGSSNIANVGRALPKILVRLHAHKRTENSAQSHSPPSHPPAAFGSPPAPPRSCAPPPGPRRRRPPAGLRRVNFSIAHVFFSSSIHTGTRSTSSDDTVLFDLKGPDQYSRRDMPIPDPNWNTYYHPQGSHETTSDSLTHTRTHAHTSAHAPGPRSQP
jgi:hypothetical protein